MPILALCRTAVDADIEGNISEHLKHTIYEYLKTDTLNFYDDLYQEQHQKVSMPIVEKFNKDFNMEIKPSDSFVPPEVEISPEFI